MNVEKKQTSENVAEAIRFGENWVQEASLYWRMLTADLIKKGNSKQKQKDITIALAKVKNAKETFFTVFCKLSLSDQKLAYRTLRPHLDNDPLSLLDSLRETMITNEMIGAIEKKMGKPIPRIKTRRPTSH